MLRTQLQSTIAQVNVKDIKGAREIAKLQRRLLVRDPPGHAPVEDDGEALGGGGGVEGLKQCAADCGAERLGHALHARPRLHLYALPRAAAQWVKRLIRTHSPHQHKPLTCHSIERDWTLPN